MKIESPEFEYGDRIPEPYSRFGENLSPPLVFRDVPANAQSLVLIVDDPGGTRGTFTHWVLFNLDPKMMELPENARLPEKNQGRNSWNEIGYGGPRPPNGEHRYFFKLFALDRKLDLPAGSERTHIEAAMRGHVIAEAEWMGRFATPVQAERDAR